MDKIIRAYTRGYRVDENGDVVSPKGEPIKGYTLGGYLVFTIHYGAKALKCKVHRLQAFQKYGEKLFEEGIMVRHLNGINSDNSWSNIAIGNNQDNQLDIPEAIRVSRALYATSFVRKHDRESIVNFHTNNGHSYKKTMEEFNISSKGTLHFILNGKKDK